MHQKDTYIAVHHLFQRYQEGDLTALEAAFRGAENLLSAQLINDSKQLVVIAQIINSYAIEFEGSERSGDCGQARVCQVNLVLQALGRKRVNAELAEAAKIAITCRERSCSLNPNCASRARPASEDLREAHYLPSATSA